MDIRARIKETIKSVDPTAEVILFGSRARGDARPDSDWDILILLNRTIVKFIDGRPFRNKLYEIELDTGENISTIVRSVSDWNTRHSMTPLYFNVSQEGINL